MSDAQLSKGEAMALARRAVACKAWRWMGGMFALDPRYSEREPLGRVYCGPWGEFGRIGMIALDDGEPVWTSPKSVLPDLTDPATLGCLLALVRRAWGEGGRLWQGDGGTWVMEIGTLAKNGDTEAEALVRALEAAP